MGFISVGQGWRTFSMARAQTVYKFRSVSRANGNFKEQNKVLEPSTILIKYRIIIIIIIYAL